jgi:hypothetical protein
MPLRFLDYTFHHPERPARAVASATSKLLIAGEMGAT